MDGESSDSSDDFDVTNAPEESDDDLDPSTTGKSEEWWSSKIITDSEVNKNVLAEREAEILSMRQVGSKKSRGLAFGTIPSMGVPPATPMPGVGVPLQLGPRKRGRPRKSLVDPLGNVVKTNSGPQARPPAIKQSATPALAYKTGYGNGNEVVGDEVVGDEIIGDEVDGDEGRRQQTRQHYEQYIAYRGRAPPIQAQTQTQAQAGFEYVSRLTSEAQVRVALDYVAHSQGNVSIKERHIAALFHRLEEVRIQSGISQS